MAKFHINKNGVPAPCNAKKGNCPLGGNSGNENHFNTAEEAQIFIDKENEREFELMPEVSDKLAKPKLTSKQEIAKQAKADKEKLTKILGDYWQKRDGTPDESMVKHCLKSSKYVKIGDSFVDVADAKPTIHSEMWYDDETDGPTVNFENFRNYNIRMGMPKTYEMTGRNRQGTGTLKMIPQYDGVEGFELAALTYENEEDLKVKSREVSESELKEINNSIKEVREDYEKRLKTYYKRYGDKIRASGYWKNR